MTSTNPTPRKAVRRHPIAGEEPTWVHDLPLDNILSGMTMLLAEICILRDRVKTLERELTSARVLAAGAIESHVNTAAEKKADEDELKAIASRFWTEVSRDSKPWASVSADQQPESVL